jgi:hypothetical protein
MARQVLTSQLAFELGILGWASFLQNGALPAVLSYAASPYVLRMK